MTLPTDKITNPAPSAPTAGSPAAEEERLWQKVLDDAESDERHKEYFNFALRNGFMKEASRRYGQMVGDKDKFSVEERRQFRKYQQTIVNLMFMGGPRDVPQPKSRSADAFVYILAALLIVAGILLPIMRIAILIGMAVISVMVYFKVRAIKSVSKGNRRLPE